MRRSSLIVCTSIICLLLGLTPAAAEWVSLDGSAPSQPQVSLVAHDSAATVIELSINGFEVDQEKADGTLYHRLSLGSEAALRQVGLPLLPVVARLVGIPDQAGYIVSAEILDSITLTGYHVWPAQQPQKDGEPAAAFAVDRAAYDQDKTYPAALASAGDPQIWRDVRLTRLEMRPITCNPARSEISVATRMRVTISYTGMNPLRAFTRQRSPISEPFQNLYRSAVINYNQLGYPAAGRGSVTPGTKYLVVTTPACIPYIQDLVDFRHAQGYPVEVRTLEPGFETAAEIKAYITQLYNNSGLEYVLMVGDAYYSGSGGVDVPMYYWTDSYSDSWFTMMDGSGDYLADMAIGRILYDTAAELQHQITKTVDYLTAPEVSDWAKHSLLVAHSEEYPGKYTQCSEEIRTYAYSLETPNFDTAYGGAGASNQDVIDYVNTYSSGILNYRGHGSAEAWWEWGTTGDFNASHVNQFTNVDRYFVHFDVCCDNMDFPAHSGDCFAETMMKTTAGAVAINGAIIPSYTIPNHDYDKEFYKAIFDLGIRNLGYASNYANVTVYNDHGSLGESNIRTYLWLGDSCIDPWTDIMATPTVAHPGAMIIGTSTLQVSTGIEGAMVCAQNDEVYEVGYTDATGAVTLTFATPPVVPGALTITVTAHNMLTYQEAIPVIPPSGPYVVYEGHSLDDDAVGSSNGNGDGIATPGETIELDLMLKNYGVQVASGVVATVSSPGGHISFLDDNATYGSFAPDESKMNPDPIVFDVLSSCPHGEIIQFNVEIASSSDTWYSTFFFVVEAGQMTLHSSAVTDFPNGNGDGNADMGETVFVELTLENVGAVNTTGVSATITSNDPSFVVVLDDTASFPDIISGATGTSLSPNPRFAIDLTAACGQMLSFNVNISTDQGSANDMLYVQVGGTSVFLEDDIEAGPGEWTHSADQGADDWGIITSSYAHSPVNVWFSANISSVVDKFLISRAVTLTPLSELTFWHRYYFESGYDGCLIEISTDGGTSWADLGPVITEGQYNTTIYTTSNPLSGRGGWSGNSGTTMTRVTADLAAYAGTEAHIRFRIGCDSSVSYDGWYIDDVTVTGAECQPWSGAIETLDANMSCNPSAGTVPFTTRISVLMTNLYNGDRRRIAAQLDVNLANGQYYPNWRAGFSNILPGNSYFTTWPQLMTALPSLVGVNTFTLVAEDVTPAPFNQPPYPASGDTDTANCTVTGIAP